MFAVALLAVSRTTSTVASSSIPTTTHPRLPSQTGNPHRRQPTMPSSQSSTHRTFLPSAQSLAGSLSSLTLNKYLRRLFPILFFFSPRQQHKTHSAFELSPHSHQTYRRTTTIVSCCFVFSLPRLLGISDATLLSPSGLRLERGLESVAGFGPLESQGQEGLEDGREDRQGYVACSPSSLTSHRRRRPVASQYLGEVPPPSKPPTT